MDKYFFHLDGPAHVGIGEIGRLITEDPRFAGSAAYISIGDMISERLGNPFFAEKYAGLVRNGDLLPDKIVCELLEESLAGIQVPIIVIGGFMQTSCQIAWARVKGLLMVSSTTVSLKAEISTCWFRYLEKKARRPIAFAPESSFANQIERHQRSVDKRLKYLHFTGTKIIRVNADRPLESEVFPDVAKQVEIAFCKSDHVKRRVPIRYQSVLECPIGIPCGICART